MPPTTRIRGQNPSGVTVRASFAAKPGMVFGEGQFWDQCQAWSVALAEVSLRLQYVTEEAEFGREPFTFTVDGADEIGSKVSALPVSRQ